MNAVKKVYRLLVSRPLRKRVRRAHHVADTALRYPSTYFRYKFTRARRPEPYGPIKTDTEGPLEIHTVTGHRHVTMALWALLSWYVLSGRRDPLCVHDDGSLTPADQDRLRAVFPNARVVSRAEADESLAHILADFPRCRAFREAGWPNSAQLFDYALLCRAERLMSFDSDLLFFRYPEELIRAIEQGVDNADAPNWFACGRTGGSGLAVPENVLEERTGIKPYRELNNGFGVLARRSMAPKRTEELLARLEDIATGHPWWTQTLVDLLSAEWGVEFLSADYHVAGLSPPPDQLVQKHYTIPVRELFWAEGLPAAVRAMDAARDAVNERTS